MDSSRLATRIIAAGLPLLVIALVFGGAGYALKQAPQQPIPELPAANVQTEGARGVIQSAGNGEIAIMTEDGASLTYQLPANATVEVLRPISAANVNVGDWLNGGAIPHAQSVFALVGIVLIPDPVTP